MIAGARAGPAPGSARRLKLREWLRKIQPFKRQFLISPCPFKDLRKYARMEEVENDVNVVALNSGTMVGEARVNGKEMASATSTISVPGIQWTSMT